MEIPPQLADTTETAELVDNAQLQAQLQEASQLVDSQMPDASELVDGSLADGSELVDSAQLAEGETASTSSSHRSKSKRNNFKVTFSGKPQQPFKNQKGGQRSRNLSNFVHCLDFLSEGDPLSLIIGYLSTPKGRKLIPEFSAQLEGTKLDFIISKLLQEHSSASDRDKARWISLLSPIFTRDELSKLGFHFSTNQYSRSLEIDRTEFTTSSKKRKTPDTSISNEIKGAIREFCVKRSRPAANRTIIVKTDGEKQHVPVRYLDATVAATYTSFVAENPTIKVSESCFRKYVPKEIKRK